MDTNLYQFNTNVHMLIGALKEYGVRNCVLSPGASNAPIVHLLELDEYFTCYSIVDERAAGFFAMGLAQSLNEPVAMCCTSGTAGVNYAPAMNEAFFQGIPIIAITADRCIYYEYQMLDQKIPQNDLFKGVVKREATLPYIRDDLDCWYCNRILNETLIEFVSGKPGPVHFNVEMDTAIYEGGGKFKKIQYIKSNEADKLCELANKIGDKKLLIIWGQSAPISKGIQKLVEKFEEHYNCVIATENISNLHTKYSINLYMLFDKMGEETFKTVAPDYIISVGGQYLSGLRRCLMQHKGNMSHWLLSEDGNIADHLKKLSGVMDITLEEFLKGFTEYGLDNCKHSYYEVIANFVKELPEPEYAYSNNWAMQQLYKRLPKDSILHLGIDSIVRVSNSLSIDSSVTVFSNRGTTGIEGTLPAFIGQAYASKRPAFLVIGDLSFFYGMNGIWNSYLSPNIRIMLCNNGGGETFYWNCAKEIETKDNYIAAAHKTVAKGWVESMGFVYLAAENMEEFENALEKFLDFGIEIPVFLEIFTDKKMDAEEWMSYEKQCQIISNGWNKYILPGHSYIIYGIGKKAKETEELIVYLGGKIWGYCVTNLENEEFHGKPVISASALIEKREEYDKVIISSALYYEDIRDTLRNIGLQESEYVLVSE